MKMTDVTETGSIREANQLNMLKSILNGMEALITVCDPITFEILFINDSIRNYFGIKSSGVGQMCYKVLQRLDAPCPTCPYQKLRDEPDKILTWEHREAVRGRILQKTARMIDWPGGRRGHLEYALDVTEQMNALESSEYKGLLLSALNRMALILFSRNEETFGDIIAESVGVIAAASKTDRVSVFRNAEKPDGLYGERIIRWEGRTDFTDGFEIKYTGHWKNVLGSGECLNGLVRDMPEAEELERYGCRSLLAVPVIIDGGNWGFVLFENLAGDRVFSNSEVSVLRAASFMLISNVIRNEETKKIRQTDERLKLLVNEVERQNNLLYAVNQMSSMLLQAKTDTFEEDFLHSMSILAGTADVDRIYIWENFMNEGELYCKQIYEWSGGAEPQQGKKFTQNVLYRESAPDWETEFLRGNCVKGIVGEMSGQSRKILVAQGILSFLAVPIFIKGQFWGFVGFDDCRNERVFSDGEERILLSASELAVNAVIRNNMEKNIHHLEAEADKIFYDPLTGIYNRRFFDDAMSRTVRSLSRSGGNLSLMMIDIDYFKPYNDTYGHIAGDNCLRVISGALRESVTRADDFVARYGGEEFVVVLPNTDETGARMMARRLLKNIRGRNIPHEKSEAADCVTISIGVATGRASATQNSETYVQSADAMLYEAKRDGRNRYALENLPE